MTYQGYHPFRIDPVDVGEHGEPIDYGSFEVFHNPMTTTENGETWEVGYYWWACFPGCLPDGEPCGPFETAREAYNDAIGA